MSADSVLIQTPAWDSRFFPLGPADDPAAGARWCAKLAAMRRLTPMQLDATRARLRRRAHPRTILTIG